ncbi:MAG TPA: DUF3256 family protein [Bacteroidales bacterium]
MKSSFILFVVAFLTLFSPEKVEAQNMSTLFLSMPEDLLYNLNNEMRRDLIDLNAAGKKAIVTNIMEGTSELQALTSDYLLLHNTSSSTIEAKILPLDDSSKIICVITTIFSPVADSKVEFYSLKWEPLKGEFFTPLTPADFTIKLTKEEQQKALSLFDAVFLRYTLSPLSTQLTATLTSLEYLLEESRKEVLPSLKSNRLNLQWNGKFSRSF